MLLERWEQSHQNRLVTARACSARAVSVVLFLALLSAIAPSAAQEPLPLTLAEAEDLALHAEPGQAAMLARANSLEEQAVAAGELPDPTLRVGLANFPVQSGGFATEAMTQAQLGIRQAFPPGKTRAYSARRFQSLAAEMDRSADARARDVLTSVRSAWLDVNYWEHAHALVSESRPYFEDLVTVTRSLYSVGKKDQQDVLRADLELSRLDDRLIDIRQQRARARAALGEWLGDDARRPLADRLPPWQQLPPLDVLQNQFADHPALQAADARVAARIAGIDLAKERFKPGWAMDLGYGYRDGSLPNGSPRSDFVSLSVTVDLPFFRRNRQDRSLAAALGERRAAVESKEELRRHLASQLEAEYSRWQELSRRIDLYERVILLQAEDRANAALAAYQSETGDFADVMRGSIDALNSRLDHIRLQTERDQSYAVLANLGGISR